MICRNCNTQNEEGSRFCQNCGAPFDAPALFPPFDPSRISYPPLPAKTCTWPDILAIIGFIFSIAGFFWFSAVLYPLGFVLCLCSFLKNKTKKLAIAGIVIAAVGGLIRIGYLLETSGLLPDWITSGLFS